MYLLYATCALSPRPEMTTTSLCRRTDALCIVSGKTLVLLECRKLLKTMNSRGGCPRQLLAGVRFDEWREGSWIVEHRNSDIYDGIKAVRSSKHPTHAVRTEEVTSRAVKTSDNRFTLGNYKPDARNHCTERERACTHSLASRAMASHSDDWRRSDSESYLSAPTSTF
jgi:hypothetical protein